MISSRDLLAFNRYLLDLYAPGLDLEIVNFAVHHGTVVFPGAMTPGEVTAASKAGADFVKIFPCAQLGGPNYIKALKAPFPNVAVIGLNCLDLASRGGALNCISFSASARQRQKKGG